MIDHPVFDCRLFGGKLRKRRLAQGLSLEAIAARAGIGRGTLSRIERGRFQPNVTTFLRLCKVMGLRYPMDYLVKPERALEQQLCSMCYKDPRDGMSLLCVRCQREGERP